jgi:thiol-disulfide isomerase/thioredoxin
MKTTLTKTILWALLPLFFAACSNSGTTIIVEAKNYNANEMEISWGETYETLKLKNGRGKMKINVPENTRVQLASIAHNIPFTGIDDNGEEVESTLEAPTFSFYTEKGTITISFDGEKWPELTITGGSMSAEMDIYWRDIAPLEKTVFEKRSGAMLGIVNKSMSNEELSAMIGDMSRAQREIGQLATKFIDENPSSMLALAMLSQRFDSYRLPVLEEKFATFDEDVRNSSIGQALTERIAQAKAVVIGGPAPQFTKKDKDGKAISLSDYRGKYVFIDFWGSWCGPCRASHPHVVELYNKYSPLGLEFIHIAQEGGRNGRAEWLKAIEEDGLVWTNILDNEDRDVCNVVQLYAISAFPTKVLIDPQGRIVGKWVGGGSQQDEKLKEIFGI